MSIPVPTDPHGFLQYQMINAHITFKCGYDSILTHLENPPLRDLSNFLGYCEAWAHSVHEHHESEEHLVFLVLQPRLDMSREIEQHKVVHAGLESLFAYIKRAREDRRAFDAAELRGMMEKLKGPLYEHLDDEVAHISAENLVAAGFTADEMRKLDKDLETYARSHGNVTLLVPYMRSHTVPEMKDIWPPMPWALRKVLIPYMIALRHSGYWKYSPYAMS
ncbi:hypothetical protein SCP_0806270 [Sparassis crispa]|uniref:Hemerythrin-like domain-containing protein n=1 Tax=Sparassis crispa TaxID=139825 RepID=A0A401GV91_9APHY|nr:hypothetical protein SCP_0806270 [Sparassis crispa]GBE86103.1 hypothetical protein SCP_0806270 [Sparassis crispa]